MNYITQEEQEALNQSMVATARKYGMELDYLPPPQPPQEYKAEWPKEPVFDYRMKRWVAAVGTVVVGYCFCAAADKGALTGPTNFLGWGLSAFIVGGLIKFFIEDCFEWKR